MVWARNLHESFTLSQAFEVSYLAFVTTSTWFKVNIHDIPSLHEARLAT